MIPAQLTLNHDHQFANVKCVLSLTIAWAAGTCGWSGQDKFYYWFTSKTVHWS